MKCLFEQNYTGIGEDEWSILYTKFVDLSGASETKEYELLTTIHNLQIRISTISILLQVQTEFFRTFELPFIDSFADFKKYGYRLFWKPEDPSDFINQLESVESQEKRYVAELNNKLKDLKTLKSGEIKKPTNESRIAFVKQLNALNKDGYRIDKDMTDAEELALMIKASNDNIKLLNSKHGTKYN